MSVQKPCLRCLLDEADPDGIYRTVKERIDSLDESIKTDSETYLARLEICKCCDSLISGTCVLCGCFAQLRAAKAKMHCPDIPARW